MRSFKRLVPYVVVFITSMGIMIIELVASRMVSKYFGSSLYTWTGVIGIVLGGISLGNYLGGRLADRYVPSRIISILLLLTSLFVFLILVLDILLARIMSRGAFSIITTSMVIRSVMSIFLLFFIPSTMLGTVSPVMAKYALEESTRVGNTVGGIYATASIGSILGTFLSGFVLIPMLGLKTIVFLIGTIVVMLSFIVKGRRMISLVWLCVIVIFYVLFVSRVLDHSLGEKRSLGTVLFSKDSRYSYIEVRDLERGEQIERILFMDGLIHNRYDPLNPDDLCYDYEKIFRAFTEHYTESFTTGGRFSTLTLGGGAMLLPVYLERNYGESRNEVVEIDPEVVETAYSYFDIPRETDMIVHIADARSYVYASKSSRKYDLVFLDAFNSFSVPSHLTTREFTRLVLGILNDPGYFIVNCVDIFGIGKFLNAYINTVRSVFPYLKVYSSSGVEAGRRDTFVLIAGNRPIGIDKLHDRKSGYSFYSIEEELLMELERRNGEIVLTDDHSPVENLMAPVFLHGVE
jgi:MFS family permease